VPLRDDYFWPRVNRKEQTSAYPPFAELGYRALSLLKSLDTTVFKLGFVALDLATVGLLAALLQLRGRSPTAAIIYAWHPLPIVEFAGSAHIDVLAVLLLVAALLLEVRGHQAAAGVALGLATLTKLYPGLLLPAFTRRDRWRLPIACVATVVVGFAPALLAGDTNFRQFPTYLSEEGYESGERFFPLLLLETLLRVRLPAAVYIAAAGAALVALALWLVFGSVPSGRLDVPRRALLLAGAILLLVTPAYPWYFIWLIPLIAVVPVAGLWYLTVAVPVVYLGWNWQGAWRPPLLPFLAVVYVPTWVLLAGRWWSRRRTGARDRSGLTDRSRSTAVAQSTGREGPDASLRSE
jgi:alpha-1,6-mannosyltransferase